MIVLESVFLSCYCQKVKSVSAHVTCKVGACIDELIKSDSQNTEDHSALVGRIRPARVIKQAFDAVA